MKICKVIEIHNLSNMFHLHTFIVVTAEMKILSSRFALKPMASKPYLMQTSLPLQYMRTVVPTILVTWLNDAPSEGLFLHSDVVRYLLMGFRNLTSFPSSVGNIVLIFSGSL